jgi:hypothetical protein
LSQGFAGFGQAALGATGKEDAQRVFGGGGMNGAGLSIRPLVPRCVDDKSGIKCLGAIQLGLLFCFLELLRSLLGRFLFRRATPADLVKALISPGQCGDVVGALQVQGIGGEFDEPGAVLELTAQGQDRCVLDRIGKTERIRCTRRPIVEPTKECWRNPNLGNTFASDSAVASACSPIRNM